MIETMNAVATGPKSHRFRSRESIPELAVRRYRVGRNPAQEARPRHAKYPFFFLFATCSSPIALSSPPPSFFPLPLSVPVSHTPPPHHLFFFFSSPSSGTDLFPSPSPPSPPSLSDYPCLLLSSFHLFSSFAQTLPLCATANNKLPPDLKEL